MVFTGLYSYLQPRSPAFWTGDAIDLQFIILLKCNHGCLHLWTELTILCHAYDLLPDLYHFALVPRLDHWQCGGIPFHI